MPASQLYVLDLTNLKKLPHLELGHWVVSFAEALAAHPDYQGEGAIPSPVPNAVALNDLGTRFLAANAAAETKHVDRVAERDALRPQVELRPAITAHWAVLRSVSENNPRLIANLPLPYKKKPTKSTSPSSVITAPQKPRVKHGKPGAALVSASRVPKARTYDVGICQGDPSLESSWTIMGPFDHCLNIELSGLEPGKLYYFRVRCFVGGAYSPWSDIVSIRVL